MATFKISGIWKNSDGIITHYAFHSVTNTGGVTRVSKKTKAEAINLLDNNVNTAKTWIWNYKFARFVDGQNVEVVGSGANKYLRSDPDDKLSDNLGHLLNLDWFM